MPAHASPDRLCCPLSLLNFNHWWFRFAETCFHVVYIQHVALNGITLNCSDVIVSRKCIVDSYIQVLLTNEHSKFHAKF